MLRGEELCPSVRRTGAQCVTRALVILLLCLTATSASAAGKPWLEILRQDDSGVELLLHAGEPQVDNGVVDVPGFQLRAEHGQPRNWSRAAFLAVPGARGASLQILEERRRDLPGVLPQTQWDPALIAPEDALADGAAAFEKGDARRSSDAWMTAGRYPLETVQLSSASEQRGVHVVMLEFVPLQYRAAGAAQFVDEIRVRIQFRDRPTLRDAAVEDAQLRGLVNHAIAARWQPQERQAPSAQLAPGASMSRTRRTVSALPKDRLQLTIPETGIYSLDAAKLEAAGVPIDVDPRSFRLYMDEWNWIPISADSFSSWSPAWEMQEVDIWVRGEQDASLDALDGDAVVFYAVGPGAYLDLVDASADSLAYARHPYDENRYAWLVWGGNPATSRMQEVSVSAPDPITDPVVQKVWHREHFEADQQFGIVDDLWYWQQISSARPALATFSLDLANEDNTSGTLRVAVGAKDFYYRHAFDTTINQLTFPTTVWDQPGDFAANHYVTYSLVPLLPSDNQLRLKRNESVPGATGQTLFLKFDVTYERLLAATQTRLSWSYRHVAATEVFELGGFGGLAPGVFDVTDPQHPIRMINPTVVGAGAGAVWRVRYGRAGRSHYQATTNPIEPKAKLRQIEDVRARPRAPHMMFVTDANLHGEVDRLAAHRKAHFYGDLMGDSEPDFLITDVQDIYDNFSGGRMDPLAIRNYLRYLYDKDAQPRLQYLMLVGEATHDPRRNMPASTPTLVPTVHPRYADTRLRDRWYAVDDWLAEMSAPMIPDNFGRMFPLPDFAVGRVTARSSSDARLIVDKIIAYETRSETGAWRTTVLLAADDEHHRGRAVETFHINNIERLPALVPEEWDVEKFYLTEYPLRLGQKPDARAAFIRRWSAGVGVVIFQGHGAPRQMADEVLFLGTDIPALVNGLRLPVFMAFSCTVAEFDDPELQSMSEEFLTSQVGGAIAVMGATTPTFAGPNALLNEEVFSALWEFGPTSRVPLGQALMLGKQRSTAGTGKDNERYTYIGDPAMPLRNPNSVATFQSGADTLGAGAAATIAGRLEAPDGSPLPAFQGEAEVAIYGSANESGYKSIYPPNVFIPSNLRGAPVYRGEVPVVDGKFTFDFFVPANAVLGNKGRLSVSAAGGTYTAVGGRSNLFLKVADVVETDSIGPSIALRFPSDLTHVKPGTELVAEIQDPQGINIQGLSLFSSILLDFDESNSPLDITSFFRYKAGSSTFGTVSVSVPDDLTPGPHTATLLASDNLQNPSSKTISFQVVEEQVTQLVNVVAFPNPFRDRTHFIFEITDGANVEVQVFTSSGRRVWRYQRDYPQAGQVTVEWLGVDQVGDTIANGTYLYRVRAYPHQHGASSLQHDGTVVMVEARRGKQPMASSLVRP